MIGLLMLAAVPGTVVSVFGVGSVSCATAFQRENMVPTEAWVEGFWSGVNISSVENVGHTTDVVGLMAEVKQVCGTQPSMTLMNATLAARQKLKRLHR